MLGKAMLFSFFASAIWFSMVVSSGKKEKQALGAIFFISLHSIVLASNMCLFKNTQPSLGGVLSELKNDPSWALHDLKQDYKEHHISTIFLVICLFSFAWQPFTAGFLYFAVELSVLSMFPLLLWVFFSFLLALALAMGWLYLKFSSFALSLQFHFFWFLNVS